MSTSSPKIGGKALFYMALLAVQFGIQPILTRRYTPPGITRSTVILVQEVIKFLMALAMLEASGGRSTAIKTWSVKDWVTVALAPAALYAVQNVAALTAYQNLDALTFNVLNQTKTMSAALCCYLVMGRKQSQMQVFALLLLLMSALVMEKVLSIDWLLGLVGAGEVKIQHSLEWERRHWTHGVAPILLASFISGLTGALSQKNLQAVGGGRNPFLFSMELCAGSSVMLLLSMSMSEDGRRIAEKGFWDGWTVSTLIPIVTNAMGGIIVGLVTKHAGSVRKGFALIFGILLSGVIQAMLEPDQAISNEHIVGGVLAAASLYLHSINPPMTVSKKKKE